MRSRVYRDPIGRCKDLISLIVRTGSNAAKTKPGEGSVIAKCLDQRPSPLVNSRERFGILWAGKAGSMAVTWWFLARLGLLDGARQLAPNPHHYRLDVLLKDADYRHSVATCDPEQLSWLRILRDPYKRAVSSYRHVMRRGFDDAEIEQKLNVSIADTGLSFAEFLGFLESVDIAKCNVHYRQQWHPLEEHVAIRRFVNIDRENLLGALDAFESELGLAPLLPETRASLLAALNTESTRHHKSRETNVGNHFAIRMTRDEANGHWPTYDAFLSDDARRAVERVYAKDFAAYAAVL